MFSESVSEGLNISTNSLGESVPSRSYMISVIKICWENVIDWNKTMMDNNRLKKKTIREFILLLSTAFFIHIKDRSQFQSHPIQW